LLLSTLEPPNATFIHRLGHLVTIVATIDCNGHVGAQ
jgi:hypothetical protein